MVSGVDLPDDMTPQAQIVEAEGTSSVISIEDAARIGIAPGFLAAWLTLGVHSTLDAVGLTAVVATTLAKAGIACNVVAGYHHDHLLVPIDRADEAVALLHALGTADPGAPLERGDAP